MTKRGKRHTPAQIAEKLKLAETLRDSGQNVAQIVQRLEITEQTFYRWQKEYGGMEATEAKRLKELERENKQLKELLAEAELDKKILKMAAEGNW